VDQAKFEKILGRDSKRPMPEVRSASPKLDVVAAGAAKAAVAAAASKVLKGRLQRFGDAVDTDAIIPGEFCHLTKLEEIGAKAFVFVRPEFPARVKEGRSIVVAGEGWGSGSSREHAVWALVGSGVQCVIAKSYAFIHKRNLVNEAVPYLVVRDEAFYALAAEDQALEVDVSSGVVTHVASGKKFTAETPSAIVQALAREGGLVPAVKRHGPKVFEGLAG